VRSGLFLLFIDEQDPRPLARPQHFSSHLRWTNKMMQSQKNDGTGKSSWGRMYKKINFYCIPLLPRSKYINVSQVRKYKGYLASYCAAFLFLSPARLNAKDIDKVIGSDQNLGLLCGYNALAVLDFDNEHSYYLFKSRNRRLIENTPVSKTHQGYHVFIRYRGTVKKSGKMFIDGKVAGDFMIDRWVVIPPSRHPKGSIYRWHEKNSPDRMAPNEVSSLSRLGLEVQTISMARHYKRAFCHLKVRGIYYAIQRRFGFVEKDKIGGPTATQITDIENRK
jgi:hypothetical protein